MSFALGGMLAGAGQHLQQVAEEKRRLANDILKARANAQIRAEAAAAKASGKSGGKGGGGRSGGKAGRGSGFKLSNSDEVRLKETYTSLYGAPGEQDESQPTLIQFKSRVYDLMREDDSLSRMDAEQLAASQWVGKEKTEMVDVERGALNLMRYIDGPTYQEPKTTMHYGFDAALGEDAQDKAQTSTPSAPTAAPAPAAAPQVSADQALAEARNAIAQGADRNTVIQRLRSMGIDPKGL